MSIFHLLHCLQLDYVPSDLHACTSSVWDDTICVLVLFGVMLTGSGFCFGIYPWLSCWPRVKQLSQTL